jgi:hypothetical protein
MNMWKVSTALLRGYEFVPVSGPTGVYKREMRAPGFGNVKVERC